MTQALMRFCAPCSEYTLKAECPRCGGPAVQRTPAKFSPEDHYGEYRRRLKRMEAGKGKAVPRAGAANAGEA